MSLNLSWAHCLHIFFFFFDIDGLQIVSILTTVRSLSLVDKLRKAIPHIYFFLSLTWNQTNNLKCELNWSFVHQRTSLLSVACLKYKSQALWMKSKTRSEWHGKTFEMFQRDEIKTSGAFEATIYEFFYLKIRIFFFFFFIIYWLLTETGLVSWCKILVCLPGTSNASFYQRHFTHHHTMMRSMMPRNLELLNSSIPRYQKLLFNPNFRTNKRNFHSRVAANIQHRFKMVHNAF